MPIHGLTTNGEYHQMSYDLAKLYLQLKGTSAETPAEFVKEFKQLESSIYSSLRDTSPTT